MDTTLKAALSVRAMAFEWPRCGQGWPANAEEVSAEACITAAGVNECGRTPEQEAAVIAARVASDTAAAERAAKTAADRVTMLDQAAKTANGDLVAFINSTGGATIDEAVARGWTEFQCTRVASGQRGKPYCPGMGRMMRPARGRAR